MNPRLLASIQGVEAALPMVAGGAVEGRLLLVDGDGLAYSCAGRDDTSPGEARFNLIERVKAAQRVSGASRVLILATAEGSHKGYRYAIARAKPYQGQRSSSRRPANWRYLRDLLTTSGAIPFEVELTHTAEADDLFGKYSSALGWDNAVIYTHDKDIRMVPGLHLEWDKHVMTEVPPGAWCVEANDKVYGQKWFWLQVLQGDSTDNVPGLPRYVENGKEKLIGPKGAESALEGCDHSATARAVALDLYRSYYGERAEVELAEQAVLLWMRRDRNSAWFDVFRDGHPLERMGVPLELCNRIHEATCLQPS